MHIEQLLGTCDVLCIDVRCGGGVIAGQCRNGKHVIAIYIAFCGATARVEFHRSSTFRHPHTSGRTSPIERSARHRDRYLHNTQQM